MKQKLLLTLALLGLLVIAYIPAFAQAPDDDVDSEVIVADEMGHGPMGMDVDEEMIFAGDMGPGMGMGMKGRGLEGIADELELTKDQRKQLEDQQFDFRKGMIPMRAQLQVLNLELQKLIRNDAKAGEIDAQIDQIGKLRTEMQKQAVKHRMTMKSVLTPEQRDKLNDRSCMMGKGKKGAMRDVIMKRFGNRGEKGKGL